MRCYFLRDNKIEAAYLLKAGNDADLVLEPGTCSRNTPATEYRDSRSGTACGLFTEKQRLTHILGHALTGRQPSSGM
jgi:hypothetical protein